MSRFDEPKQYYVFKYVIDKMTGDPTNHEGEVQAFIIADNPWEAVEKAGFTDCNTYGASEIENLDEFEKAISEERKHLSKISKQLKVMTDARDEERKKFLEEKPCPNGCGKMDDQYRCKECGFGYEGEQMLKEIEKAIKDGKKAGEDTSQLEAIRDMLKESLK